MPSTLKPSTHLKQDALWSIQAGTVQDRRDAPDSAGWYRQGDGARGVWRGYSAARYVGRRRAAQPACPCANRGHRHEPGGGVARRGGGGDSGGSGGGRRDGRRARPPAGGSDFARQQILAHDKVVYHGHAIAAVAASNAHVAAEAARLIEVEYDVLPHVLTAPDAMRADAPILHECLRTNELGVLGDVPTNVASHSQIQRGDVEAGFADAAVVVERRFVTQTVHQGYIEPHTATAQWNAGGHLQIWCSTQGSHSAP